MQITKVFTEGGTTLLINFLNYCQNNLSKIQIKFHRCLYVKSVCAQDLTPASFSACPRVQGQQLYRGGIRIQSQDCLPPSGPPANKLLSKDESIAFLLSRESGVGIESLLPLALPRQSQLHQCLMRTVRFLPITALSPRLPWHSAFLASSPK